MDRLPEELLQFVINDVAEYDDYASRADLKNLRLTNKIFADIAAPQLYRTMPLWLSLTSLQNLTEISEHPRLSPLVTNIEFSPLRFKRNLEEKEYRVKTKDRLERRCHSMNTYSIKFGKHVLGYNWYLESQHYLAKEQLDSKILIRAFRALRNLRHVKIANRNLVIGAEEILRNVGSLQGEEVTLNGGYTIPLFIRALVEAEKRLKVLEMGQQRVISNDKRQQYLMCCIRSLRPRQLDVKPRLTAIEPWVLNTAFPAGNLDTMNTLLSHLQRLEIHELSDIYAGRTDVQNLSEGIKNIVLYARELKSLCIGEIGSRAQLLRGPQLHDLVPLMVGLKSTIRDLCIKHVDADEADLVNFILSQRSTLERVKFAFVRIRDPGSWSSVLHNLRHHQYSCLKMFAISFCFASESDLSVAAYIKNVVDEDPIIQYQLECGVEDEDQW